MPYEMPWRCADYQYHANHRFGYDWCAGYAPPGPEHDGGLPKPSCLAWSPLRDDHAWAAPGYACVCGEFAWIGR